MVPMMKPRRRPSPANNSTSSRRHVERPNKINALTFCIHHAPRRCPVTAQSAPRCRHNGNHAFASVGANLRPGFWRERRSLQRIAVPRPRTQDVSPLTRNAIYFSRFDRDIGDGRIHPDAPLNLMRDDDGTADATKWRPTEIDWSAPFPEVAKQWSAAKGLEPKAAAALLEVEYETWRAWLYGKSNCSQAGAIKKLMKMI